LYKSAAEADKGTAFGGTGFLVAAPSEVHEDTMYIYCVTNSHVIREGKAPVVRLNTKDGGKDIIEFSQANWVRHQDGDDLEAAAVGFANPDYYKYSVVPISAFVTEDFIEQQGIGPGDEVFMVGRLVNHQGQQRNTPVVRFGNISMLPYEPIRNERGLLQESFLVETRSLSGFSGSPVFVYFSAYTPYPTSGPARTEEFIRLLGVDWGHVRTFEPVMEENEDPLLPRKYVPVKEGWVVPSNSGQMMVVPAWKLRELLDQEEFAVMRRSGDEEIAKRKAESPAVFDAHGAGQSDEDHSAFTEADFEDALDKVSRRESPPDQES
jgi:hypothetical protein